jgi:hypothetical protein
MFNTAVVIYALISFIPGTRSEAACAAAAGSSIDARTLTLVLFGSRK